MEHALARPATNPRTGMQRTLWKFLRQWHQNTRTRHQLAELDSGVSPSERVGEISKPFWR